MEECSADIVLLLNCLQDVAEFGGLTQLYAKAAAVVIREVVGEPG